MGPSARGRARRGPGAAGHQSRRRQDNARGPAPRRYLRARANCRASGTILCTGAPKPRAGGSWRAGSAAGARAGQRAPAGAPACRRRALASARHYSSPRSRATGRPPAGPRAPEGRRAPVRSGAGPGFWGPYAGPLSMCHANARAPANLLPRQLAQALRCPRPGRATDTGPAGARPGPGALPSGRRGASGGGPEVARAGAQVGGRVAGRARNPLGVGAKFECAPWGLRKAARGPGRAHLPRGDKWRWRAEAPAGAGAGGQLAAPLRRRDARGRRPARGARGAGGAHTLAGCALDLRAAAGTWLRARARAPAAKTNAGGARLARPRHQIGSAGALKRRAAREPAHSQPARRAARTRRL